MNITAMIAQVREERDLIEQAIFMPDRITRGRARRRVRLPKWLASATPKRRGRPLGSKMSPAARKAQSQRMKAYWAARRRTKSR
jgi:hypothetical protein